MRLGKTFAGLAVAASLALAQQSCDTRLFTLQSAPGVKIKEFVDNIADECDFTVLVKDKYAKKRLNERLGKIVLDKASLYDILHLILEENDLTYTLEGNTLKISYLVTKTFHVDYVTSKRVGETKTDASIDVGRVTMRSGNSGGGTGTNNTSGTNTNNSGGGGSGLSGLNTPGRDINTIFSKEEFDFWSNLQQELRSIINRPEDDYLAPDPVINEKAGLVTVTATKKQMKRVEEYLSMLEDRLHKEVLIDVSILAVVLDTKHTTGIDWSQFNIAINGTYDNEDNFIPTNPAVTYTLTGQEGQYHNLATTIINSYFNLTGLINFLKESGDVYTLSNPKILTLNNQPAIISIGETLNYNVATSIVITATTTGLAEKTYTPGSIFVGILLNITPEITRDNDIILRINPSISELRDPEQASVYSEAGFREIAPDTKEKKLSSVVKVKDGSTLILGGLISNTKNFTINGVPILKDVPLFGNLFGSKKRQNQRFELIFVIRPKVIENGTTEGIGLKDLGYKDLVKYE
ncbi:MAG: pilus (MSHA type) biogenesis protein MshL [Epsilonproteobacteria bacterium]|nr:pilus (MSHA type) biogenesis protein MshL [Campylobacterota bacterium]